MQAKYAALFSYWGKDFVGWQRQKGSGVHGGPSIQATIEDALAQITQEKVSVVGSGRTDSGVHATGQVAHFRLKEKPWKAEILQKGLNSALPPSIRALKVQAVPMEFHAQRSATHKQYSYYFQQGPSALPHLEPFSWWIRKPLNLEAMNEALGYLKGEHDFKPFQSSGSKPGPTVRKILEAEAVFEPLGFPGHTAVSDTPRCPIPKGIGHRGFGLVRVRLVGTGFLKQMVRGIAGTLLQVGENRRKPTCFREILQTLDRSAVGPTAPGRALWLERVWYPDLEW